jgi:hypothetical protein
MDLGDVECGGMDWTGLDWTGLVWSGLVWSGSGQEPADGSCEQGHKPPSSIKCWKVFEWRTTGGLSSCAQLHRGR